MITEILANSPAEKSEMEIGDTVLGVNSILLNSNPATLSQNILGRKLLKPEDISIPTFIEELGNSIDLILSHSIGNPFYVINLEKAYVYF